MTLCNTWVLNAYIQSEDKVDTCVFKYASSRNVSEIDPSWEVILLWAIELRNHTNIHKRKKTDGASKEKGEARKKIIMQDGGCVSTLQTTDMDADIT